MVQVRSLTDAEIILARGVYGSTIPFDRVTVTDLNLGGAVTLAGRNSLLERFSYTINWVAGFGGIMDSSNRRATLIHELCHVWQGENGIWPTVYIAESAWAQLRHGIKDLLEKKEWRGWPEHRSTAYPFAAADIGRNWSSFNVEQQASIVESWYMPERDRVVREGRGYRVHNFGPGVYGGGSSPHDARYPYIRDVIRGRSRNAPYQATQLAAGADAQIKAIQDKLVALGYLDPRHADGFIGGRRSATLDAVQAFQRRNGLRPDRVLGGPNSETRRKLAQPANALVRVQ